MDREQEIFAAETAQQRADFSAAYAEWLRVRGMGYADDLSDEESISLLDREGDLAQRIWAMPSVTGWQVLKKLELLETYHDKSEWIDQRDIRLIASIRADLQELLS
jgi:hypothetical protein